MLDYQIFANSIKNKKDQFLRNGNYFLHKLLNYENLLFMALSEGIDSTDCYWIASKMICENSFRFFTSFDLSDKSIESRLLDSIEKANQEILKYGEENCKGMLATLCIAVWDINKNKLYYAYVGDSRLYHYSYNGDFKQISKDQKESVILMHNDKHVFTDGVLATRSIITNSLGQANPNIEVFDRDFKEGESLFMATSGFYEVTDVNSEIPELLKSNDIENDFNSMMGCVSGKNVDDSTVLLLRRNDVPDFVEFENLSELQQNQIIVERIINSIKANDRDTLINDCEIHSKNNFKLGKNNYIKIMNSWVESELYIKNDVTAYAYICRLRK